MAPRLKLGKGFSTFHYLSSVMVSLSQGTHVHGTGKTGKMAKKKSLSGKTQRIWEFCQNTGKTQGIWFAEVVNSLILKPIIPLDTRFALATKHK